jgi:hypothetical protein
MQIDRSNYEIWFIDWLDGNLDSSQVEQLKLFLDKNPDLREEFNDMTPLALVPSGSSYPNKVQLKKSLSDISLSQFEYLCAAYLENDLSESQQAELKEITYQDPDKKKTFDLILKTRLYPANISYEHKNRLLKRTAFQKVIRLAAIGLSAAATIALIITTYSIIPQKPAFNNNNTVQTIVADSNFIKPFKVLSEDKLTADNLSVPARQKRDNISAGIHNERKAVIKSDSNNIVADNLIVRNINTDVITVNKVPVYSQIDYSDRIISNTLVASKITFIISSDEDERSNVGRFISKVFRERILKEKSSSDRPLQGYEIAEAGVTGLNKLLGWEMALDRKNDENGVLRSVYFSSKILKFNAPVKKSEPLQ